MQSRWVDRDAKAAVDRYAAAGISPDLALRVYTTRLARRRSEACSAWRRQHLGQDSACPISLGDDADVLCVKGSGCDMARDRARRPAGGAASRRCISSLARDELSDEDMVRVQRANLLDPMAPNPSVETLLHAFMPHKFVDHTHANAVVSLIDQPDGAELCAGGLWRRAWASCPTCMPGFGLAKAAAAVFEHESEGRRPHPRQARHLHLRRERARSLRAHDRAGHARAKTRLQKNRKAVFVSAQLPQQVPPHDVIAPFVRGACSVKDGSREGAWRRPDPRFPLERRDPQFRQRQGRGALQPGRRRHAGHHHPHQELRR